MLEKIHEMCFALFMIQSARFFITTLVMFLAHFVSGM